jgi:hypothetical protein
MDDDDFFLFEIHFGGRFKNLNGLVYVNSDVTSKDVGCCDEFLW